MGDKQTTFVEFKNAPPERLPVRDPRVLKQVREGDFYARAQEPFENPEFLLRVEHDAANFFCIDLFHRIRLSDVEDKRLTVILPSPEVASFVSIVENLNKFRVSCRNLHVFFSHEFANERDEVAPPESRYSRSYYFMKYFYGRLAEDLRPDLQQIHFMTKENIADYGRLIGEAGGGGADVVYSSVSWLGGFAGIDPVGEFFTDDLEKFLSIGSRVITPLPETIAEDSLRGMFGSSGDIGIVPPKVATVGPKNIVAARYRFHFAAHYPCGGSAANAWQRYGARLATFGEVTPRVPASMLRLYPGISYIDVAIAEPLVYAPDYDPLRERNYY